MSVHHFADDLGNDLGDDLEVGELRRLKAKKTLFQLPELLEGQVWACDTCGGGICRAVKREQDYSVSHNPETGETIRKSDSFFVSSCCTGDLSLWSNESPDADPVEIPEICYVMSSDDIKRWSEVIKFVTATQTLPAGFKSKSAEQLERERRQAAPFMDWLHRLHRQDKLPRGKFFKGKVGGKPFFIMDEFWSVANSDFDLNISEMIRAAQLMPPSLVRVGDH